VVIDWKITNLTRDVRDNYVFAVKFKVTATEGLEVVGESSGEIAFMNKPSTLPSGFIPYEKLDEATTIKWVKDTLGSKKINEIEQAVEVLNKLVDGKPWE
tara:strand:+ start:1072 stop:1371 length:300 start_codon:yes stop_codon:yes gene_type:complete